MVGSLDRSADQVKKGEPKGADGLDAGPYADAAEPGDGRSELLEVWISAGLEVLTRGMEKDRADLCSAGGHDGERQAERQGTTSSEVTLGGLRIPISRPRVRG